MDRWPLIKKSNEVVDLMKFPNGTVVGVHDTWTKGQKGEKPNRPNDPIVDKYIRNVELWHFGHFALTRGDKNVGIHSIWLNKKNETLPDYKNSNFLGAINDI